MIPVMKEVTLCTCTHRHTPVSSLRQGPLLVWCCNLNAYQREIEWKQKRLLESLPDGEILAPDCLIKSQFSPLVAVDFSQVH